MKLTTPWIARMACGLTLAFTLSAQAATILVDFGYTQTTTPGNWNNIATSGDDMGFSNLNYNLIDTTGATTGYRLDTVATLMGVNTDGATTTDTGYPATATRDSFYFTGSNTITLTLTNLDPTLVYDFSFYASRNGSGTRLTKYEVTGGNKTEAALLNVLGNVNNVASLSGFTPDADGIITIVVSRESGEYAYLGVMQVTTAAIPEPSTAALVGAVCVSGLLRRRKR
jgi:hypothetical protein